jgi:hypothetical protein
MKFLLCTLAVLALASAGASTKEMEFRAKDNLRVSSPMAGALQQKKAQGDKIKTIEEEIKTLELKEGPPGPPGTKGVKGDVGPAGQPGGEGPIGARGPIGATGYRGARGQQGERGDTGRPGLAGRDGAPGTIGKPGPKGDPGTGLKLKEFAIGTKYVPGDYVFHRSSTGDHDSMFIAERYFVGRKPPAFDIGNWEEFRAPKGENGDVGPAGQPGRDGPMGPTGHRGARGEQGEQGNSGRPGKNGLHGRDGRDGREGATGESGRPGTPGGIGKQGPEGLAGTGLTLKTFSIGTKYYKGDYVFSQSTSSSHNSMFIAENNFLAKKKPSEDLGNWDEFQAPKGEKGDAGAPGKEGESGKTGPKGEKGSPGKPGQGLRGASGPTGPRGEPGKSVPTPSPTPSPNTPTPSPFVPSIPATFVANGRKFYKLAVKGTMNSANILKACEAKGLLPACDHSTYADGECVIVSIGWHLSHPAHVGKRKGYDQQQFKDAFFYAGSAKSFRSLQNTGSTHRWSDSKDKNKNTFCTIRREGSKYQTNGFEFKRVRVSGAMNQKQIQTACKAAKMKPLCDNSAYSDGICLSANANWHWSHPAHLGSRDYDGDFFTGAFFYASNAKSGRSLMNRGDTHRWSVGSDSNGETVCAVQKTNLDFKWSGRTFIRTPVEGNMISSNILKACEKKGLSPVCDHSTYADGECVVVGKGWHFSHPGHVSKQKGLDQNKLHGAYFYSGSAKGGQSLENLGNTHAWSNSRDKNGETYCTKK